jgi:hypothetical protein
MKYEIDITKPPIGPPGRIIKEGYGETDDSKQNNLDWKEYALKYSAALQGKVA